MMRVTDPLGPEWAKGYSLDYLKALAAPFQRVHKPLVFGAFALVKERDLATALQAEQVVSEGKGAFEGVAILQQRRAASTQQDFAQREFTVPAGAAYIAAMAALSRQAAKRLVASVLARAKLRGVQQVWAEIFEEDADAKAAILSHSFTYVGTKIAAGSEIKGVYVLGAAHLPLAPLGPAEEASILVLKPDWLTPLEHELIKEELDASDEAFAQHYSGYNKRKSWTALALRGYDPNDPQFIIKPSEMSKAWKDSYPHRLKAQPKWTSASKHFKTAVQVTRMLDYELDRVRFMRLREEDGELSRHADITDRDAGVRDGKIVRLHVPIITSDKVRFSSWTSRGERKEICMPERALCYLDQRKPHAVKNLDPTLARIHLVIDCVSDTRMRATIANAGEHD